MIYYDDILNVNAYLQSKIKTNMADSQELLDSYRAMNSECDAIKQRADALLLRAQQLANDMGVDVSDFEFESSEQEHQSVTSCSELLVEISEDFDFSAAFTELCEEAHKAGFTDVRPEDLLSVEEMEHADNFSRMLDERFKSETGLSSRDYEILIVAIVIRVFCHYTTSFLSQMTEFDEPDMGINSELFDPIVDYVPAVPKIRHESQILSENIPFELPDNEYFLRCDILGFHPQLGWLMGVINILTNSVTTKKMESFSVVRLPGEIQSLRIDERIPTFLHLLIPVLHGFANNKEAILAAVVREAGVLHVTDAPAEDVIFLLQNIMEIEERNQRILEAEQLFSNILPMDIADTSGDGNLTAFINKLITAIHAVRFNPEIDGDIQMYAVRTNKILSISSAVSALIKSLPAVISHDFSRLDFEGIVRACLSAFSSARFWVEVKTNYLVSEYKVEIDKQMRILDKYFIVSANKDMESESKQGCSKSMKSNRP